MKFLCESCERFVPLESFRLQAGMLVVVCGRCGAEHETPAPDIENEALAPEGPEGWPASSQGAVPGADATSAPPGLSRRSQSGVDFPAVSAAPPPPSRASSPALRVVRPEDAGRPAPAGTAEADPFAVPPGFCPKCIALRQPDTESCASCGLVYANFLPEEHQPSDAMAAAWRVVCETWEDWKAHDWMLTQAMGRGELAMAGRLYRLRLAQLPGDAQAQRGRDEVLRRVTTASAVEMTHSKPPTSARRLKVVLLTVVFLMVVTLAVLAFRTLVTLMNR